jgi:hypothetical protein
MPADHPAKAPHPTRRVFAIVLIGGGLVLAVISTALRPHWITASRAEVDAVIDPILLKRDPPDPAADARFQRFSMIVMSLNPWYATEDPLPDIVPDEESLPPLPKYSPADTAALRRLRSILSEGPYRIPARDPFNLGSVSDNEMKLHNKEFEIERGLAGIVRDQSIPIPDRCDRAEFAELLAQRRLQGSHDAYDAEIGASLTDIADSALRRLATSPQLTAPRAKRMLTNIPDLECESKLEGPITGDFQRSVYPLLPDPQKFARQFEEAAHKSNEEGRRFVPLGIEAEEQMLGSYDAIRTAKELSNLCVERIKNCNKPPKDVRTPVADAINSIAKRVPNDQSDGQEGLRREWAKFQFRYALAMFPNSFTYRQFPYLGDIRSTYEARAQMLAWHRLTRLQLAGIIFTKEHGQIPKTLSELVDARLLPSVPEDPFTAAPMHYDPHRGIIWSVGENGTDDGGVGFTRASSRALDFVVSLKPLAMKARASKLKSGGKQD